MRSSLAALVIAALVAAALTPAVRRFAVSIGAVDQPSARRVNAQAIPRLGGLAVATAFFAAFLMLFALDTDAAGIFFSRPLYIVGLAAGGLILCVLGAIDDVRGVRAWHKLVVQIAAALVAYACGFRIDSIALPWVGALSMGVFAPVVTTLWIVAVVNAINLIDGLDGLAAGVTFFACVANFAVAMINGDPFVMLMAAALGGSVVGFLFYNFNPASIFMGDSGSMFLGFILATMSVIGNAIKHSTTVAILVPLIALGLPIMDTLFAMGRRVLERRPIFSADKGHIHHRLLDLGITHRRVVLILYGFCIVFTGGAIAVSVGRNWLIGGALLALSILLVGIVRFVGYFETAMRRRRTAERLRDPGVDRLLTCVPPTLANISATTQTSHLRAALEKFAVQAELFEIEFSTPDESALQGFRWFADSKAAETGRRDLAESTYSLATPGDEPATIRFVWAEAAGDLTGRQADILLQLVVDAVTNRLARREDARTAVASGHLRPVP